MEKTLRDCCCSFGAPPVNRGDTSPQSLAANLHRMLPSNTQNKQPAATNCQRLKGRFTPASGMFVFTRASALIDSLAAVARVLCAPFNRRLCSSISWCSANVASWSISSEVAMPRTRANSFTVFGLGFSPANMSRTRRCLSAPDRLARITRSARASTVRLLRSICALSLTRSRTTVVLRRGFQESVSFEEAVLSFTIQLP